MLRVIGFSHIAQHKMKPTYRLQVPNRIFNHNFEVWWKHASLINGQIVFALCHVYVPQQPYSAEFSISFFLFYLGWHMLSSHASAEACLTG